MDKIENNEPPTKNPVGRPPVFKTPEDMQEAISNYFLTGIAKRKVVVGKGDNKRIEEIEVPTITGLCIYLGFESRQSFYAYEAKDEFCYTIKKARLFIENEYEEQLTTGNTVGAIFALKNFGWKDQREISGPEGGPIAFQVVNFASIGKE